MVDIHRERDDAPKVQMDYMFAPDGSITDSACAMVSIVVAAEKRGAVEACVVQNFAAKDAYAVKVMSKFVDSLGNDVVEVQSDAEVSLVQFAKGVAVDTGKAVRTRTSPRYSHHSNGRAEAANKSVRLLRTYKVELKQTTQTKLKWGGFLFPWHDRHAAWSMTRFETNKDGHSADYRLFGTE